jgi:uncharacterized FlaG/YvyC family protein
MEVKEVKVVFPETFSSPDVRNESVWAGVPKVSKKDAQPEVVFVEDVQSVTETDPAELDKKLDKKAVADLMERTSELLSVFDRELKYELQEEAGVVQIQVIDSRDGRVVRKIPADEVIKFLELMKTNFDDRVDVWA